MMIATTINTHVIILGRLAQASAATGLSKQKIISWLLKRFADDAEIPIVPWSGIRYQVSDMKENWHRLHVVFSSAEYELLLDLKKAYKLSASRIIAYSVEKYLNALLGNIKKYTDNYRISNYLLLYGVVDNVACCVQFWGIPQQPQKYAHLIFKTGNESMRIP